MKIPYLIRIERLTIKPLEERHFVTLAVLAMITGMMLMAREDPRLWDVELFKTLLTAIVVTGFLNMILSYHFSANKSDVEKSQNTARAFEAITETVRATASDSKVAAARAAAQTAEAAQTEAESFQEGNVGRQ